MNKKNESVSASTLTDSKKNTFNFETDYEANSVFKFSLKPKISQPKLINFRLHPLVVKGLKSQYGYSNEQIHSIEKAVMRDLELTK